MLQVFKVKSQLGAVSMRLCLLGWMILLGWGAMPVQASVQAVRAVSKPVIDGKLDDACWQTAKPFSKFWIHNTEIQAEYSTQAMVTYDDEAIYVAFRCAEPRPENIQTRVLPRDSSDVFRTDCVEVMLDPEQSRNDYFHFGVNASGSVTDLICSQGGHTKEVDSIPKRNTGE